MSQDGGAGRVKGTCPLPQPRQDSLGCAPRRGGDRAGRRGPGWARATCQGRAAGMRGQRRAGRRGCGGTPGAGPRGRCRGGAGGGRDGHRWGPRHRGRGRGQWPLCGVGGCRVVSGDRELLPRRRGESVRPRDEAVSGRRRDGLRGEGRRLPGSRGPAAQDGGFGAAVGI